MWEKFIEKVVDAGGIVGVAAVILALISVYLFKRYEKVMVEHRAALAEQNEKCVGCMRLHDDQVREMMKVFYDTHRADLQANRAENNALLLRVVDSNEVVADSVNKVNNTLAGISGRLNGRG